MENFTPDGYKTFYWSNGNKRQEGKWVNGIKTGLFKLYHEDGTLMTEIIYKADVPDGIKSNYDNNIKTVDYIYNFGTLEASEEYNNSILVGTYNYGDANIFLGEDNAKPPAVGYLYHAFNSENPNEIFLGTYWTFVESHIYVNDGVEHQADIWVREPNYGRGPYLYDGLFKEYDHITGLINRSGSYKRYLKDEIVVSSLHDMHVFYRADGINKHFTSNYNKGTKIDKMTFYDSSDRIRKVLTIVNGEWSTGAWTIRNAGVLDKPIKFTFSSGVPVLTINP